MIKRQFSKHNIKYNEKNNNNSMLLFDGFTVAKTQPQLLMFLTRKI